MVSDENAYLATLKRRLDLVRAAQRRGYYKSQALVSGLLVSQDWFKETLETRALKLEGLIVDRLRIDKK